MSHWVDLLRMMINAECPHWDLLQAFRCLSLTKDGDRIRQDDEKGQRYVLDALDDDVPLYTKRIEKLAALVDGDPDRLRKQIDFVSSGQGSRCEIVNN